MSVSGCRSGSSLSDSPLLAGSVTLPPQDTREVSETCSLHGDGAPPSQLSASGEHDGGAWDITFSFSCGGWFQMYFFGAAHALVDTGLLPRWEMEGKRVRFTGASAGSLVATCLASGQYDFESIRDFSAKCAQHFRQSWRNLFCMRGYLTDSIAKFGTNAMRIDTDPLMRERLGNGCLEVAVTVLPFLKARLISGFQRYEQLHEALLASCCMVPLVGVPFKMKTTGEWVTDGGVASFTPRVNEENVISVSGMYFQDASVRPRVFVPSWWALLPPDDKKYRNLFWMGYNDMIDTLVAYGLLDRELGEYMLRPETDFKIHDNFLDVVFTVIMEVALLVCVRPFIITCIYVELAVSIVVHAFKVVVLFDGSSCRGLYESFRSATSLRSFFRLLFGKAVPNNEERLSKRSWLFRLFEPLTFGGTQKTGRECWTPKGSPNGRRPTLSPNGRRPDNFKDFFPSK